MQKFSGWADAPTHKKDEDWLRPTLAWGDNWLLSLESLLAGEPSVVVPEKRYLLLFHGTRPREVGC